MAFREIFLGITNVDPLRHSATIASACARYWQTKYLKPGQVARTPEGLFVFALTAFSLSSFLGGYERNDRQSSNAIKYLKWLAKTRNLPIQHRDSPEGEFRFGSLKLDGFVRKPPPQRSIVFEVYGCLFHGCRRCLKPGTLCLNGKMAWDNYTKTMERERILSSEFSVEAKWECEIREMLSASSEMREFFEQCHDTGPIDARAEAFYGGRTGPIALHETATPGKQKAVRESNRSVDRKAHKIP